MKSDKQEPVESQEVESKKHMDSQQDQVVGSSKTISYEILYARERKKSQVLLISTGVFVVLFFVSLAFGLRVADHDSRNIVQPGGMMPGDFDDHRGMGGRYYR